MSSKKLIRARKNASDPEAEMNITKFLRRMKKRSENLKGKLTVAVEVTKKPRFKKTVREFSLMENLAWTVNKTETLVPLINDQAKEDHMLIVGLEKLMDGFSSIKGEKKLLSEYTEERIAELKNRLRITREMMDQNDEGNGTLSAHWAQAYNELKLMRHFVEFGHVDNVGRTEEVMQEAKGRVEMRMLKIIKNESPDLIIVYRYLEDVDPLGYEEVGMAALSRFQPTPFPLPPQS